MRSLVYNVLSARSPMWKGINREMSCIVLSEIELPFEIIRISDRRPIDTEFDILDPARPGADDPRAKIIRPAP
jgi:hypothetical protein